MKPKQIKSHKFDIPFMLWGFIFGGISFLFVANADYLILLPMNPTITRISNIFSDFFFLLGWECLWILVILCVFKRMVIKCKPKYLNS
jgi:hypothetical protein